MIIKITKSQITKLCGRRGVSREKIERFFAKLPEKKEIALEQLDHLNANKATIGAIKSGILISYSEELCHKN
jgi:hypothetical protein